MSTFLLTYVNVLVVIISLILVYLLCVLLSEVLMRRFT